MKEGFNWFIGMVGGLHGRVICLHVSWCEATVGCVQMHEHLPCGDVGKAHDAMVEAANVEILEGAYDLLFERFVSGIQLGSVSYPDG